MLNQVIMAGRLTKNPELKESAKGTYCKIRIAVQRPFKNKDGDYETDFFDVTTWQGNAENVNKYCKKGSLIMFLGRVAAESYVNKDNQKVYKNEIYAERVVFVEKNFNTKDLGEETDLLDIVENAE